MEHAQRGHGDAAIGWRFSVLILILMEHAQRVVSKTSTASGSSLNPYFNGTCSKREVKPGNLEVNFQEVLILILMEHAQRACNTKCYSGSEDKVLILILMEHAQRDIVRYQLFHQIF